MKAIDIKWDTDCDRELFSTLPQEIILPKQFSKECYACDGDYNELILSEDVSDWLSNEYGYCHSGFKLVEDIE